MSVQQGNNPTNKPEGQQTVMGDALSRAGVGAGSTQQQAGAATARPAAARSGRTSILDINTSFRRPVARNAAGEQVQAISRALQKAVDESMDAQFKQAFSLHILDNSNDNVALSTILAVMSVQKDGVDHLAVYSLIVENSGARLSDRFVQIGSQTVQVITTAGDVADKVLWDKISTFLSDTYGAKLNLHFAGWLVIPTEMSAEDEFHVRRVLFNATQALYTVLENDVLGQEAPVSISMVDPQTKLTAVLDYNSTDTDTATGLPVRSSLSVVLRGSMQQGGQGAITQHERVREITRVDGFMDLVYQDPPQQQWNAPPVPQRYYPRYVMTRVDSELNIMTPELQLLAIATTSLLAKNMAWGGAFQPRHGVSGTDLRDIGAIGYEVNLSGDPNAERTKIDTKLASFTNQSLYQLLQMAIFDQPLYSLDIEEVGELSWLHQNFLAAATGDQDAYGAIVEAANRLTDGQFGRIWTGGQIAHNDDNRIHLGYYVSREDGRRHDIREIDYLALLNLQGEADMQTVIEWSRTFDDTSVPLEMRLEKRARILVGLLGDSVTFKGYARRVTLLPEFMLALNQAAASAGLSIQPSNLIQNFTGQIGRGGYNAAALAVNPANLPGVFNYSGPGYGNYRGVSSPFFGRFGR